MLKKVTVSILLLLGLALTADLNEDYAHILQGETPLEDHHIEEIYGKFLSHYQSEGPLPSHKFVLNSFNRKEIFERRLKSIIQHNQNASKNFKKGLNKFSDMTFEEFKQHYHLKDDQDCSATNRVSMKEVVGASALGDVPSYWDWRNYGVVTPIKDQGECGSCWTFSTVGAVEAHFQMKYKTYRNLSEQQLVDCAGSYNNFGCDGGLPSQAFEYLAAAGGISTEDSYPYKGVDQNCTVDSKTFSVGIIGGAVNISQSEDDLKAALFLKGPVSVAYNCMDDFMDYASGVYHSSNCPNTNNDVNHAVLAVGYGSENGMDYWVCKNSWGTSWGDKGFFKIQRGVNMCGINNCNSYPADVTDLTSPKQFMQ